MVLAKSMDVRDNFKGIGINKYQALGDYQGSKILLLKQTLEALNRTPDASPVQLLRNVEEAVRTFTGDAPPFDDMTMLCIHYRGPQQSEAGAASEQLPDKTEQSL